VPGMSDIYPVDDLEWSNNNEGALFREEILSLKNLDKAQWLNILERLDAGGYNDVQRVAEFIGIAPNAGTTWATLRIGELKAMLSLAAEDFEQALEWNDWCLSMDQLGDERIRFYRALQALLEIKLDDDREYAQYTESLQLMYGAETVSTCIKLLEGEEKFYGLHSPGLSLEGFTTHQKLLEGYAKLHKAKQHNWSLV
jgi:ribosomal protein S12 methylthiotransferase accessory factor